jgi:tripartite-type tricarboxylate transporter receptor subunit TctC
MNKRQFLSAAAAAVLAGTLALTAQAQAAYPERPITLIVPWGAGGGTDATARIVASLLERELGQPIKRGEPHRRLRRGRPFGDRGSRT